MSSQQQQQQDVNSSQHQQAPASLPLETSAAQNVVRRPQFRLQNIKKLNIKPPTLASATVVVEQPPPFAMTAPAASVPAASGEVQQEIPARPFSIEPKRSTPPATTRENPLPTQSHPVESSKETHSTVASHQNTVEGVATTNLPSQEAKRSSLDAVHSGSVSVVSNGGSEIGAGDRNKITHGTDQAERIPAPAKARSNTEESRQSDMEMSSSSSEPSPSHAGSRISKLSGDAASLLQKQQAARRTNNDGNDVMVAQSSNKEPTLDTTSAVGPKGKGVPPPSELSRRESMETERSTGDASVASTSSTPVREAGVAPAKPAEGNKSKTAKASSAPTEVPSPPSDAAVDHDDDAPSSAKKGPREMDVIDLRKYPNHPGNMNYLDMLEELAPVFGQGEKDVKHDTALKVVASIREMGGRFLDSKGRVLDEKASLSKVKVALKRAYEKICLEYYHKTVGSKKTSETTIKGKKSKKSGDAESRPSSRASDASTLREDSPVQVARDDKDNGTNAKGANETETNRAVSPAPATKPSKVTEAQVEKSNPSNKAVDIPKVAAAHMQEPQVNPEEATLTQSKQPIPNDNVIAATPSPESTPLSKEMDATVGVTRNINIVAAIVSTVATTDVSEPELCLEETLLRPNTDKQPARSPQQEVSNRDESPESMDIPPLEPQMDATPVSTQNRLDRIDEEILPHEENSFSMNSDLDNGHPTSQEEPGSDNIDGSMSEAVLGQAAMSTTSLTTLPVNSLRTASESSDRTAKSERGRHSPCSIPSLADDEAALFGAIERSIIAAEERDLMEELDRRILAAEEKELLRSVLDGIEEAERREYVPRIDRVVNVGEGPSEDFAGLTHELIESIEISEQQAACSEQITGVQEFFTTERIMATKLLPKLIPGTSFRTLTATEVQEALASALEEKDWLRPEERFSCTAKLEDVEDQPDSILLKACGHSEMVDAIKGFIEVIVRSKIVNSNRDSVRSMEQILEIDVNPDLPLHARISNSVEPGHGVWMDVHEGGQLANKLGDPKGVVGCCLLQIDGKDCVDGDDVEQEFTKAKADRSKSTVQLRLSKLSNSSRASKRPSSKRKRLSEEPLPPPMDEHSLGSEAGDSRSFESQGNGETGEARRSGNGYNQFRSKYHTVREIEFGGTVIHQHFVSKCMWDQHKALRFGQSCDDNCRCPLNLKQLTRTVVREHAQREKRNGTETNNEKLDKFPVGFVNRFAPIFFPLVQEQFPNESMNDILKRVVDMWFLHQQQANFGLVCKKGCPCAEGWEMVFHKGDPPRREAKTSPGSLEPTQKKRKPSSQSSGSSHVPRRADTSLDDNTGRWRSEQVEYQVQFDSQQPLGFYVVTEKRRGLPSVCKIVSMCPLYTRDCRLTKGTIVCATGIGDSKFKISSHEELRDFYDTAGASRTISLWFINTDVENLPVSVEAHGGRRDWSQQGVWQGKRKDGWAGGAADSWAPRGKDKSSGISTPEPSRVSRVAERGEEHPTEQQQQRPTDCQADQQQQQPVQCDGWEIVHGPESVDQQHRFPNIRPILKPPRLNVRSTSHEAKRSKVGFDDANNKKRLYLTKEEPCCWLEQRNTQQEPEVLQTSHQGQEMWQASLQTTDSRTTDASPSFDLFQAIQSQDYLHVIKALRAGASTSLKDPSGRTPKHLVSDCKEALDMQIALETGDTSILEERRRDFELKRKVLNIHISAAYAIDKARYMKSWKRFEVCIERLQNICASSRWTDRGFPAFVAGNIKTSNSREELTLRPLPEKEISEATVDWTLDDVVVPVHFHEKLSQERRELLVELHVASAPSFKIGSVAIPIDKISDEASAVKKLEWHPMVVPITRSELIRSGELQCKVKKAKPVPEYIKKKQKEAKQDLSKVIQWLEQFQVETKIGDSESKSNLLDCFCGEGGVSLLHAAIYLEDDIAVGKLIALGASPNKKSVVGTAIRLAANMEDRATQNTNFEKIMTLLGLRSTADQVEVAPSGTNQEETPESPCDCDADYVSPTNEESDGAPTNTDIIGDFEANISASRQEQAHQFQPVESEFHSEQSDHGESEAPCTGGTIPTFDLDEFGRKLPSPTSHAEDEAKRYNPTLAASHDSTPSTRLPCDRHWMPSGKRAQCRYFRPPNWCDKGTRCPFPHVMGPVGADLDDGKFDLPDVSRYLNPEFLRYASDSQGMVTAGYYDPSERVYYYAEKGPNATRKDGIYWYPTKEDAKLSISRVLEYSQSVQRKRRSSFDQDDRARKMPRVDMNQASPRFTGNRQGSNGRMKAEFMETSDALVPHSTHGHDSCSESDGDLPKFRNKYWMLPLENLARPCDFFNQRSGCRHDNRCNYAHVRDHFGSVLDDAGVSGCKLYPKQLHFHEENGWYTAAYFDKGFGRIFYRAEGGEGGRLSSHGIYWYPSEALAEQAIQRVVAFGRNKESSNRPKEKSWPQRSLSPTDRTKYGYYTNNDHDESGLL